MHRGLLGRGGAAVDADHVAEQVVLVGDEPALTLVLHEDAEARLADLELPAEGEIMFIVGPEGGLSPAELDAFTAAGGVKVLVADAVLRTSTAGVVGLAQAQALAAARG